MHEVGTPIQGRPVAVPETRPNGDPERSPKGEQGRTRDTKPILQAPPPDAHRRKMRGAHAHASMGG